jgi:hypothetical protein
VKDFPLPADQGQPIEKLLEEQGRLDQLPLGPERVASAARRFSRIQLRLNQLPLSRLAQGAAKLRILRKEVHTWFLNFLC